MKNSFYCLFLVCILLSCSKDDSNANSCDASITYTSKVASIINKSCAVSGCHISGGSGNGNFSTLSEIKAKVDNGSFKKRAIDEATMPPVGSSFALSSEEKLILKCWVENGAK